MAKNIKQPSSKKLSQADTALLAAVRKGNVKRLRAALEDGANPNAEDEFGAAIAQATNEPSRGEEMVMALIAAGAGLAPLRNAVVWAVHLGNADLVRKLIAAAADLNMATLAGKPLEVAARRGLTEIVDVLIAAGANLNAGAPLVAALKEGHSAIALALIRAGAEVNVHPSVSNVTPLAQAVAANNLQVLAVLIERGADLGQPSKAVFTDPPNRNITILSGPPLTLAAYCGHADAARLLVEAGADPHRKDVDGLTPFECAMRKGHTAVADVLRAAGGEQRRDTPDEQLLAAAEAGNAQEVRRLLATGVAIETRDNRKTTRGRTPLLLAAGNGHVETVAALLAAGADLNATDEPSGRASPGLKPVISLGSLDVAEKEFQFGRTALMFAAAGGHVGAIQSFVSAGADVNFQDFAGCTPLYLAARGGHAGAVSELVKSGAKVNARCPKEGTVLAAATQSGSPKTVEALLSHGAKVNVKRRDEATPLEIAAQNRRPDLLRLLLTRGDFQGDAETLCKAFRNVFVWTTSSGPPTEDQVLATVEELVAAGADPNCTDGHSSPLQGAARSKSPKLLRVVSRLIELGADVNAGRDQRGTALYWTVVMRNIDAAKILLEHGADVQAKNEDGKTVLEFARKFYNKPDEEETQFLALLESHAGQPTPSSKAEPSRGTKPGRKAK